MSRIAIRFNTMWAASPDGAFKWRLVVDGQERIVKSIRLEVPSWTSEDIIEGGITKWHISCEGTVVEEAGHVIIHPLAQGASLRGTRPDAAP